MDSATAPISSEAMSPGSAPGAQRRLEHHEGEFPPCASSSVNTGRPGTEFFTARASA